MNIILAIALGFLGVASRLTPHPANFTAVGAIAMFLAWRLPKGWGYAAVIGLMFVSDMVLGFYDWRLMAAVYGSFAAMGLFGRWAGRRISFTRVAGAAIGASLLFYLITNFAVWAFGQWYSHDLAGLMQSYILALPFLRNSLAGDMLFSLALFGAYEWIRKRGTALTPTTFNLQPSTYA